MSKQQTKQPERPTPQAAVAEAERVIAGLEHKREAHVALGLLAQPRSERAGRGGLRSFDQVTVSQCSAHRYVTVSHRAANALQAFRSV